MEPTVQVHCCSCWLTGLSSTNIALLHVLERRATWMLCDRSSSSTSCKMQVLQRFWMRAAIALCRCPRAHLTSCRQRAQVQVASRPARARTQSVPAQPLTWRRSHLGARSKSSKSPRLLQALRPQWENLMGSQTAILTRRPIRCLGQFLWDIGTADISSTAS